MDLFHRQALNRAYKLLDLSIAATAFAAAFALESFPHHVRSIASILSARVSVLNCVLGLALLAAWHYCFSFVGLYQSRRTLGLLREVVDATLAATLAALLMAAWGIAFDVELVTARSLLLFWTLSTSLLAGSRVAIQLLLRRLRRRGRNLRMVLIVGTNARALRTAKLLRGDPALGYRLIGFVDDPWPGLAPCREHGEVVAKLADFPAFLRDNVVDEVVLCLPMRSFYLEQQRLVELCRKLGVTVRFPTDLFGSSADSDEPAPLLTVSGRSAHPVAMFFKRALDVAVAALLIVLLSPVLLALAAAVKLSSPGDVLFVQERIGLHRRRFRMFKFRTMVSDAEQRLAELALQNEVSGPVFKMKEDPRVTRVGRFLRRTSLDELPQLFNVLRGEMSLVGPRPLPVRDYKGFTEDWHRRRFSVRPGITCLWQVSGRSSVGFDQWMELDMRYIDHWSLWLDLKILLRTVPAIVRGRGAA
jgi:exopolysaccharide biosynthesis polyprenyl glycosylphosphotransferase